MLQKATCFGGQAQHEGLLVCLSAHFTFYLEDKLFPLFIDISHVKRMASTFWVLNKTNKQKIETHC